MDVGEKIQEVLLQGFALVITLSFFGGVFVILRQIFLYLKHGVWHSLNLIDGFLYFVSDGEFKDWLFYPHSWIGLHSILSFIPLSIFLISIPFLFFLILLLLAAFISE